MSDLKIAEDLRSRYAANDIGETEKGYIERVSAAEQQLASATAENKRILEALTQEDAAIIHRVTSRVLEARKTALAPPAPQERNDGYYLARISDGEIGALIHGHSYPGGILTPAERAEADRRIAYLKSLLPPAAGQGGGL